MLSAASMQSRNNMETKKDSNNNNKESELLNVYKNYRSNVLQTLSHVPFQSYCAGLTESSHVKTLVRGKHHGLCDGNSTAHAESFEYFVETPHTNQNMERVNYFNSNSNTLWAGKAAEGPTRIQVEPYHRSAAGKSVDSAQMRSPLALEKSMHFLVQHYLRVPHNAVVYSDPFKVWGYLWDRWRGIRTTWIPQLPSLAYSPLQMHKLWHQEQQEQNNNVSTMTDTYTYVDDEDHSIVLDNLQLMKENHRRMAWLQFTIAALSFAGAYLCRSHEMCMRFVQEKKNFLESLSQCFTDLAVHYRSLQQRKHAEFISLLLLLYGLRQEVKAEDRALFCKFTNLSVFHDSNNAITGATSTWMVPEEASASVNIAQCYSELVKQPLITLTEPIRVVMEILHSWAQRDWFRFFELCRDNTFPNDYDEEYNNEEKEEYEYNNKLENKQEDMTDKTNNKRDLNRVHRKHTAQRQRLSFLQRAVLFQSFTYARFRAILDLVLPNYYVYSKLRIRHYIPIDELTYLLMMASAEECEELLVNMGLGSSLSEIEISCDINNNNNNNERITTRVLLLTDDKSQPRVTGAAIEAHCGNNKEKLFYPTFPAYFGFKVWEDGFDIFPELAAELLPSNDNTTNNNYNNEFSQVNPQKEQQQELIHQEGYWNGWESEFANVVSSSASRGNNKEYQEWQIVSQLSEQNQQNENNEEENSMYGEEEQNHELEEEEEMEITLLQKINCPINLMELLEIYCPPYHDEVALLKLDDCDNKWFDSITHDRQKMLRVCLERHGKLHPHKKHSSSSLQNVNKRMSEINNVNTQFNAHEHNVNEEQEEEWNEAEWNEIDDLVAKYEQESRSTSSGVIEEMSSLADSEVDYADDANENNHQKEENDNNTDNKVESYNEDESHTNKVNIDNVATNSHIQDVVQSTQQFITQLEKDPRYASLLEHKDDHATSNGNKNIDLTKNNIYSSKSTELEEEKHNQEIDDNEEIDKPVFSSISPSIEEVQENTFTNVHEANVKTPIVESPAATPMTLSQTAPQANSTSFAIPAIANKRYISEERTATPLVMSAAGISESNAKTTLSNQTVQNNKTNELSRVVPISSKTPIVISASSSSSSSSSESRKRSSESLETEDFEESEEEKSLSSEEEGEFVEPEVKDRDIHTLKKHKVEEVEPIAITPANTKTIIGWPSLSTPSNTLQESAKQQPVLNLNDAPLLSSVINDKSASSPFSWKPNNNLFSTNVGFGSNTISSTNNNNNTNMKSKTVFTFGSWSSPVTNMSGTTQINSDKNKTTSETENAALALSPITKRESVDRSISPDTLGDHITVNAINDNGHKVLQTSQFTFSPLPSTSQLLFMPKSTEAMTSNVQADRKRFHSEIEEEKEETEEEYEEEDAEIHSINFIHLVIECVNDMNEKMNRLAWQYIEANTIHDNDDDNHLQEHHIPRTSLSRWSWAIDVNHLHERCNAASEQLQTSIENFLKHVYVRLFASASCFPRRSEIQRMSRLNERVQRAVQCALLLSEINISDYTEWLTLWKDTSDKRLSENERKTTQDAAQQTLFTFEQQILRSVCRGFTLSLTNYNSNNSTSAYKQEKSMTTMKHFQEEIARLTGLQLQRLNQFVNKQYKSNNTITNNSKKGSGVPNSFFSQVHQNALEIMQIVKSHHNISNKYDNRKSSITLPIVKFTFTFFFAIAHNKSNYNGIITFDKLTDKCMMQCIRLISTYVVSNPLQHSADDMKVDEMEDEREESLDCNLGGSVVKYHELLFAPTDSLQNKCNSHALMSTCIQYDICDAHNLPFFFNNKNTSSEATNVSLCNSVTLVTFLSGTDYNIVKGNNNKDSNINGDDQSTNVDERKQLIHNVQELAKHVFHVNSNKEQLDLISNCSIISGVIVNVCLHEPEGYAQDGNTSSHLQNKIQKLQETLKQKFWDAWEMHSTSNCKKCDNIDGFDRCNSVNKVQDSFINNAVKPTLVIVPMFLSNCVEAFVSATETILENHKSELDDLIYRNYYMK